jgi:hypothetical protein
MIVGPKLTCTVGLRDEGKVSYSLAPLLSPIPCSALQGGKPGI